MNETQPSQSSPDFWPYTVLRWFAIRLVFPYFCVFLVALLSGLTSRYYLYAIYLGVIAMASVGVLTGAHNRMRILGYAIVYTVLPLIGVGGGTLVMPNGRALHPYSIRAIEQGPVQYAMIIEAVYEAGRYPVRCISRLVPSNNELFLGYIGADASVTRGAVFYSWSVVLVTTLIVHLICICVRLCPRRHILKL